MIKFPSIYKETDRRIWGGGGGGNATSSKFGTMIDSDKNMTFNKIGRRQFHKGLIHPPQRVICRPKLIS